MPSIRHLTVTVAGIVIALLTVTSVASAQQQLQDDGQHVIRIGAAGGVVVPTSNTRAALRQGVQAQAFLLVNVLGGLPLRFNLGYQKFGLKQALAGSIPPSTTDPGSTQILAGVAGTQIDLMHGPVRPYITLGLGGFNIRSLTSAAAAGSTSTSESKLDFGIDGGAGLSLRLGRLNAFLEGHVQNVYSGRGLIDAKSIQAVPVSFGVLF